MPTLAELTLQLSQDITKNEHDRMATLAALEVERVRALRALPGSASILAAQDDAIRSAERDHEDTLADIGADLRDAERQGGAKRRADEDAAERKLRAADDAADATLRAAEDQAREAFDRASQDIERRDLTPGEKVLARADARREMDAAIKAAQEANAEARLKNGDVLTQERRDARDKELTASADNLAKAAERRKAAERVFEQAIKIAAHTLERGLADVAGAPEAIARFASRRDEVHRTFDAQDEAIRAEFRRKRNELGL
jgi:hypothetical protein